MTGGSVRGIEPDILTKPWQASTLPVTPKANGVPSLPAATPSFFNSRLKADGDSRHLRALAASFPTGFCSPTTPAALSIKLQLFCKTGSDFRTDMGSGEIFAIPNGSERKNESNASSFSPAFHKAATCGLGSLNNDSLPCFARSETSWPAPAASKSSCRRGSTISEAGQWRCLLWQCWPIRRCL